MISLIHPKLPASFWLIIISLLLLGGWAWQHQPETMPASTLPQLSHPSGYYKHSFYLNLTPPTSDSRLIYTLDGSLPEPSNSAHYKYPIRIYGGLVTVIRVQAILPDNTLSDVVAASYLVDLPAELPLLSLVIDPADFWDEEQGIYSNYNEHGQDWERPVTAHYVGADRVGGFAMNAGIRIHGRGSRLIDKKSFRLYFREEYDAPELNYQLFDVGDVQSFQRLVIHNGGQDATLEGTNWTHIRNQLAAELAFDLGLPATRSQPVLLYINGELWGVYQIRERIDEYFLADHYGISSADLLDTPEEINRDDQEVLGNRNHWDHLMNYLETHHLTDSQAYEYVQTQVDLDNFIDYQILQIYAANDDWPQHNVTQFRPRTIGGRWQWAIWDTDRAFAYRLASPVNKNMIAHAKIETHPNTTGRHSLLFRRLLENDAFRAVFLERLNLLLDTVLSPESVETHINQLAEEIATDIIVEPTLWETDGTTWETNIGELRDFARRRPDFIRQHVAEAFPE